MTQKVPLKPWLKPAMTPAQVESYRKAIIPLQTSFAVAKSTRLAALNLGKNRTQLATG